jgi:hypothetical protein
MAMWRPVQPKLIVSYIGILAYHDKPMLQFLQRELSSLKHSRSPRIHKKAQTKAGGYVSLLRLVAR